MELEITSYYCLCEELLSALNIEENSQIKTGNAEVMTVLLTAAAFFSGHIRKSANFLREHGYIPDIISESSLNRRLHAIDYSVRKSLFFIISEIFKKRNQGREYIPASFPVPVCDNIRISRARIFKGEEYRGYIASKKRYFYGLRVHIRNLLNFYLLPGLMWIFLFINSLVSDQFIFYKIVRTFSGHQWLKTATGFLHMNRSVVVPEFL